MKIIFSLLAIVMSLMTGCSNSVVRFNNDNGQPCETKACNSSKLKVNR